MLRQHREVVSFPEKGGQVGGQRVDKRLPLRAVRVRFQHAEVATKIIQLERAQATHKTVVDHVPLVIGKHNPRALVD
ncbi:hypothetical protein D3C76_1260010 [compost metagenome]